jgi:hypothetical protein
LRSTCIDFGGVDKNLRKGGTTKNGTKRYKKNRGK